MPPFTVPVPFIELSRPACSSLRMKRVYAVRHPVAEWFLIDSGRPPCEPASGNTTMTARPRRRLTVLFVLALFTLPVQALVGPALRTPDMGAAAREWVADLSPTALHGAATDIRAYPFEFRRAIMAALTPDDRVSV